MSDGLLFDVPYSKSSRPLYPVLLHLNCSVSWRCRNCLSSSECLALCSCWRKDGITPQLQAMAGPTFEFDRISFGLKQKLGSFKNQGVYNSKPKAWFPYNRSGRPDRPGLLWYFLKRSGRPRRPLRVCGFHIFVRVNRHAFVWWKSWSVRNQADNNLLARTRFLFYKKNFIRRTRLKFAQNLRTC